MSLYVRRSLKKVSRGLLFVIPASACSSSIDLPHTSQKRALPFCLLKPLPVCHSWLLFASGIISSIAFSVQGDRPGKLEDFRLDSKFSIIWDCIGILTWTLHEGTWQMGSAAIYVFRKFRGDCCKVAALVERMKRSNSLSHLVMSCLPVSRNDFHLLSPLHLLWRRI